MMSADWGDGSSGPSGIHLGCISGRRYTLYVRVHNRTNKTVTVLSADGRQARPQVMARVAMQVWLAPPPPTGDKLVVDPHGWTATRSAPVAIPPGRDAWVQSNFVMRRCSLLVPKERIILNRSLTLSYKVNGATTSETLGRHDWRIILRRAPRIAPEIVADAGRR